MKSIKEYITESNLNESERKITFTPRTIRQLREVICAYPERANEIDISNMKKLDDLFWNAWLRSWRYGGWYRRRRSRPGRRHC